MAWINDSDGVVQWVEDTAGISPKELGMVQVNPEGHPVQEGSLGINQQSYLWKGKDGKYYTTPYDGTGKSVKPQPAPAVTDVHVPGILSGAKTVSEQADAANKAGFSRDAIIAAGIMTAGVANNLGYFGQNAMAGAGTPGAASGGSLASTIAPAASVDANLGLGAENMGLTAPVRTPFGMTPAPVGGLDYAAGIANGTTAIPGGPFTLQDTLATTFGMPGLTSKEALSAAGINGAGVATGVAGATAAASGGSIWDQIAKAVGVTVAGGAASNLKDIIGGLAGAYGANDAANTYRDTMNQGMDKYTEAMKYAIDNSDPFKEQRPQYQSLLSDAMAGRLNSGNNSNYADVRTAAQGNPNMMNADPVNNPAFMNTSPTNNPWLADTDSMNLLNSPLMQNLTNTTIDNTVRRLSSKYGGDVDNLGVQNEVAKQVNAANAPLALDYYKTGLANNQQYLGTAANYNNNYLNTATNNNNNYLRTAYGNNQDYTRNLATAAGANITPQTGQIASTYAGGLADMYGKMAPINAANTNSMYGNLGIAANGLYNLFTG